jgi:hypothetical protein
MRLISADITFNFTLKTCHDSRLSSPAPTMGADKHIRIPQYFQQTKIFYNSVLVDKALRTFVLGKKY